MALMIRLMIASLQQELVASVKSGLQSKHDVEIIINVARPADAENKMSRQAINILLVDMDSVTPDETQIRTMKTRYNLLVLYTACTNKHRMTDFILKPALFTNLTASHFVTEVYKRIDGFRKQQTPPDFRDINRLAGVGSKIIAVASSTGGTTALETILASLPTSVPPLVVVQHMPSGFTKLFADRLNAIYKLDIKEASTGDFLKQGQMLLAPAGLHMKLVRQQGRLAVECFYGTKIHGVMPAADVLFESVAELVKANAIGVILTGMGADGAKGMMLMHNAGAKTIGQDAATSVVYGMPKVAKDLGAVDFELPLNKIAEKILSLA